MIGRLFFMLFIFSQLSTYANNANEKNYVWIDTDASFGKFGRDVDDGLAIISCIQSPNIEIVGISTVRFPNRTYRIVNKILGWYQKQSIPLFKGSKSSVESTTNASEAIIDFCRKSTHKVSILALGPLTNISQALHDAPDIAGKIKQIVFCGGRTEGELINPGNHTFKIKDVNFENDTNSFKELIKIGIPFVLSGFESSRNFWIKKEDILPLKNSEKEHHRYIYNKLSNWLFLWKKFVKIEGFNPFDVITAAYLTDPSYCNCKERSFQLNAKKDDRKNNKKTKLFLDTYENSLLGNKILYCSEINNEFKTIFLQKLFENIPIQ